LLKRRDDWEKVRDTLTTIWHYVNPTGNVEMADAEGELAYVLACLVETALDRGPDYTMTAAAEIMYKILNKKEV